ncbi:hypothetical protein Zmor_000012 [Zophobas morio]|uniref:ZAD domain-containing protein n=1 Tax=Zophobas morio TaxID=2755281 RepID=A0AA38MR16_9CUCU|nr:hypothetical protein Zmor_000012 [Zophobas morio]
MKTYSRKKSGEAQDVILDLNELCRLCMAKEDELVPIFNNDEAIPLTLRIMACVSLEVFEGDGLPNKICHPCKFQLEKSYNFRKKCESSDMKLRQHLRSLQAKIGDVDLTASEDNDNSNPEESTSEEKQDDVENKEEPSTEEDLVGVAQVAYIQPDPEPEDDPESITLPADAELVNKDACTLKSMKREVMEVEENEGEGIIFVDEGGQEMEDTSYDAIADAVKATLATQPDVARPTGKATYSLLPEKTKKRYEVSYVHFKNWCKKQGAKEITENVLLAYFAERSEHLKSSSLYSEYSKIKTSLAVRKEANIAVFTKVTQFLKNKSIGFCSEKSRTFSRSQMNAFLAEAPDDKFLMMKVALIFGVAGGCRREELVQMTLDNIQEIGASLVVNVPQISTHRKRFFIIDNVNEEVDMIDIYRKYAALRPPHTIYRRFFMCYKVGKCTNQLVGINTLGRVPSQVAKYLNLESPSSYNGYCFRRTCDFLKRSGGWASITMAEGHFPEKKSGQSEMEVEDSSVEEDVKIELQDAEDVLTPKNSQGGLQLPVHIKEERLNT